MTTTSLIAEQLISLVGGRKINKTTENHGNNLLLSLLIVFMILLLKGFIVYMLYNNMLPRIIYSVSDKEINTIEKIACEPIVNKKITCQVLVDFEFVNKKDGLTELLGGVPKTKKIVEYQFVQTSQGWQVVESFGQK